MSEQYFTRPNVKPVITYIGTTPEQRQMSTDEFKAKFDEMTVNLQNYIKETLLTELDAFKQEFMTHQAESASKHITESGTNPNGRYIKFDDGTMICTHSIEVGSRISLGEGTSDNPYRTNAVTWTFPATFYTAPIISGTGMVVSGSAAARANTFSFSNTFKETASNLQLVMLSNDSTDAICTIHVIAIGRWK